MANDDKLNRVHFSMKVRGPVHTHHLFHNNQNHFASINRLLKPTNFVQVNRVSLRKKKFYTYPEPNILKSSI